MSILLQPVKKILMVGVLGISCIIAGEANAQQPPAINSVNSVRPPVIPNNSINRVNTNPISPVQDGKVIGDRNAYPYGSRIGTNGVISTPEAGTVLPRVGIDRGNGSTTYYYPDGSQVDVNNNSIPPTGKLLR